MGIDSPDQTILDNQTIPGNQITPDTDEFWMCQALQLASKAAQQGEVPVGAVIVKDHKIIGEGYNQPISNHDPSAHAEIIALRDAGQAVKNYRLIETTLYVTLEPCVMCMGAILHARIHRLVFGATDAKRGAVCSALHLSHADFSNHQVEWISGVLGQSCSELISGFFQTRR
jgi:tRNA(adenine34) deaminase